MELVKLGKKGQVTIPRSILKAIGIADGAPMVVDTTADGAIVLRQAAVYRVLGVRAVIRAPTPSGTGNGTLPTRASPRQVLQL